MAFEKVFIFKTINVMLTNIYLKREFFVTFDEKEQWWVVRTINLSGIPVSSVNNLIFTSYTNKTNSVFMQKKKPYNIKANYTKSLLIIHFINLFFVLHIFFL
jgi:hypothetical protein